MEWLLSFFTKGALDAIMSSVVQPFLNVWLKSKDVDLEKYKAPRPRPSIWRSRSWTPMSSSHRSNRSTCFRSCSGGRSDWCCGLSWHFAPLIASCYLLQGERRSGKGSTFRQRKARDLLGNTHCGHFTKLRCAAPRPAPRLQLSVKKSLPARSRSVVRGRSRDRLPQSCFE